MRVNAIGLIVILLLATLAALLPVNAQVPGKTHRIGWLAPESEVYNETFLKVFLQQLNDLGWVEGQNVVISYATTTPQQFRNRARALAAELVRRNVDVIVANTTNGCLAARGATATIPIVMAGCYRPVARGLITSLRRPGGNVTGLSNSVGNGLQFVGKMLQVFQEAVPGISRVAVLFNPWELKGTSTAIVSEDDMQTLARQLGLTALVARVEDVGDYPEAFAMFTRQQADAMLVSPTPLNTANTQLIGNFALEQRLPMVTTAMSILRAGGLVLYGVDYTDLKRRSAFYVDKILKGADPADLPVERPIRFRTVVNLKTARQLGITMPPTVLYQATDVIR